MSEHQHTSASVYIKIGALLTVITLVEIWLPSWSAQTTYNVFLISLATLKFWFVVQIFMHLKNDGKLVGGIFALGLVLAGGTLWALLALMNPAVGSPSPRSDPEGHTAEAIAIGSAEEGAGIDGSGEEPAAPALSAEEMAALIERGETLAMEKGCVACHTTDGTQIIGPTWQGLLGREEMMDNGSSLVVDEAYIRESILEPGAKVVDGFVVGMMPKMPITDEELAALLAYIMTL